ncbi:MAG TPA: FISUMP domain-containing protein, partial [Fibrobacteraceae bacterium]|nr:FISUMP domain-containing protein [Fibrobacteraceae bacterium]
MNQHLNTKCFQMSLMVLSIGAVLISCTDIGGLQSPDERWGSEIFSSVTASSSSVSVSSSVVASSSSNAVSSSVTASSSSVSVSSSVVASSSSNAESSSVTASSSSVTSAISYGTLTDSRDGQTYNTVVIGTQTWMAENLNYSGGTGGVRTYTKGWCYGVGGTDTTDHSDSTTCDTYGRFYNWTDAMGIDEGGYLTTTWGSSDTVDHQGLCPSGWHVPTNTEWNTLATYLGGSDTAGYFLKSTSGWYNSGNGSD